MNSFNLLFKSSVPARSFGIKFKRGAAQPKHINKMKVHGQKINYTLPEGLGGKKTLMDGPVFIKTSKSKIPLYSLRYQPTPINDFLNFKKMQSNEILLNLDNNDNLQHSELVGGLIELTMRDKN